MIGSVPVKFTGNAATAYRFKQLFRHDLMKAFMEQGQNMDTDTILELAFVMKCQGEGFTSEQFNQLTEDDYVEWLGGMDFITLMEAVPEIIGVWADTSKITVKSKKK